MKRIQLQCDLEDQASIDAVATEITQASGNASFNIVTQLSVDFNVSITRTGRFELDFKTDSKYGGKISASTNTTPEGSTFECWHRVLQVIGKVDNFPAGKMAHEALKIVVAVENLLLPNGSPETENLSSKELILFYIREGYVPNFCYKYDESGINLQSSEQDMSLFRERLIDFLREKKEGIETADLFMPTYVQLKKDPEAAALYWKELKRLSGYR